MARKSKAENGVSRIKKSGFSQAGAGDNAAWAKVAVGAVWSGELLGRFEMSKVDPRTGKKRYYYQVRIIDAPFVDDAGNESPPMGIKRDPETEEYSDEPTPLEAGDLVNIDSRHKLDTALLPLVNAMNGKGERFHVIIQAVGKKNLDGGHTLWDFEILKAPLAEEADAATPF